MAIRYILVFLCVYFVVQAEESKKKHTKFELTSYANGKSTFLPHSVNKVSNFTPKDKRYSINPKVKIIQHKFGTMYIYDLSLNNKFLNAIAFKSLYLDGNVDNISKISLADNIYFKKDDSYTITLEDNTVSLSSLHANIDLTHLKYLVVIAKEKKIFKLNSLIFNENNKSSKISKKIRSTWAWKPENVKLDILKKHNIKQLYMQVKDGFETPLKSLNSQDIKVYGLNGSASDVYAYNHLKEDIHTLGKLKKVYPNIVGYQVDIEPYLLPEFQKNKNKILEKYFNVLNTLKTLAHKSGLEFSVVIPFWFDSLYYNNKNVGFLVSDIADEIVLMSYRSDLNLVHKISKTLLYYAELSNTMIRIGLELMPIEDEGHTIYEVTNKILPCKQDNTFSKECTLLTEINHYILKGSTISFYKQLHKLKDLDKNTSINTSTFMGYVLHHYGELNKLPVENKVSVKK